MQRIGNITGAAAEFAPHFGHQEGHVQNMDLLRQNLLTETAVEHHDVVEGQRAADQCFFAHVDDRSVKVSDSGDLLR